MNFVTAAHTDVGIKKKTNQDSLLIRQARTDEGTVLLAVICDGMGGLAKGEVASAGMIRAFSDWFRDELPGLLSGGLQPDMLSHSWENLVATVNYRIGNYSTRMKVTMGTTCVALLVVNDIYYIMNIGDSRAYLISDNVYQLTKDQTYIQQQMDLGRMTYEEAMNDPQRNVLLQCVGASAEVVPDYFTGYVAPDQCYMLCCDGFRHVIQPSEFYQYLGAAASVNQEAMHKNLEFLTELNKQRGETDNISAILIRVMK